MLFSSLKAVNNSQRSLTFIRRTMEETNRNCFVKVERWQMSVLEKGLENSLNGPVDWWLSIVSLLSGAFELTAFEHSRCDLVPSLTISSPPFVSGAFPFREGTQPPPALPSIISVLRKIRPLFESLSSIFFHCLHLPFSQIFSAISRNWTFNIFNLYHLMTQKVSRFHNSCFVIFLLHMYA